MKRRNTSIPAQELKTIVLSHFFSPVASPLQLIKRFGAIQIDPVSIVAPNQYLVLLARNPSFDISDITQLYRDKKIIEVYAKERCLVASRHAPLFWPLLLARRNKKAKLFKEYKREIKALLNALTERELGVSDLELSTPIGRDGWGPRHLNTILLSALWEVGDIVVADRVGRQTKYRLAPPSLWQQPEFASQSPDGLRLNRWKHYLESVVVTDSRDRFAGYETSGAAERNRLLHTLVEAGHAVEASGPSGRQLFVARRAIERTNGKDTCIPCFVPPLDNFIWNRFLLEELWEFSYRWEIYTPAQKRKVGPFAMPLVTRQGICGPVDIRLNRDSDELRVALSSSPTRFSANQKAAAEAAAHKLAGSLGVRNIELV